MSAACLPQESVWRINNRVLIGRGWNENERREWKLSHETMWLHVRITQGDFKTPMPMPHPRPIKAGCRHPGASSERWVENQWCRVLDPREGCWHNCGFLCSFTHQGLYAPGAGLDVGLEEWADSQALFPKSLQTEAKTDGPPKNNHPQECRTATEGMPWRREMQMERHIHKTAGGWGSFSALWPFPLPIPGKHAGKVIINVS